MADKPKLIEHVHSLMRDEVTRHGLAAWRLLGEWTGEHAASCAGASTESSGGRASIGVETGTDADEASLSRLESAAIDPDRSRVARSEFARVVVELVVCCEEVLTAADVPLYPDRSSRLRVESALAFAGFSVWLLRVDRSALDAVAWDDLVRLRLLVKRLGALAVANQPAAGRARIVCVVHQEVGSEVDVEKRYWKPRLCRWCGDFKAMHGKVPPRVLVRQHDRGLRMTPDRLRRAGIVSSGA